MATDSPYPATWALQGVEAGLSARQALAEFREAGGHVADGTWFKTYAEVAAHISLREGIYNEPTDLRPVGEEVKTWSTHKAAGYAQQVEVLVRDQGTGEIITIPYTYTGHELLTRREVINKALDVYDGEGSSGEHQQMLGAVYSGTYQMVPTGG